MKISGVDVWLVEGIKYNWTLLRVNTDEGLSGIGEATNWPGSPIIEAAARHAGERIVGMDPFRSDYIWTKLYRDLNWVGPTGASLCAISGIDMALMDLKAKALGVPLYELFGGRFRTSVPLYANYWFIQGELTPEDYGKAAADVVAQGFTGLKFDPFAHVHYGYGDSVATGQGLSDERKDLAVEVTRAVRNAVGPEVDIMIETHALLNMKTAIEMAQRMEDLKITWYEEPAGPENTNTLRAFRERLPSHVPICVGERHYTRFHIRDLLEQRIVDFLMPDITRCGGPSELKRMATMAETYGVQIAPHNPNGPLSTLASAHVAASLPNFFKLEFMLTDVPWRDEVISSPLPIQNGHLHLSDEPGLGVTLVDEVLEQHPGVRTARPGFYV